MKQALEAAQGSAVGGGVRPQRGTAADQPDPGVGRLFRPVAGRDVGAGFFRRGGHHDLCGPAAGGVCRAGPPHQRQRHRRKRSLRSGEIVACSIVGCTSGTIGSPGELKGKFLGTHALGSIGINGPNGVYGTLRTALPGETRSWPLHRRWCPEKRRSGPPPRARRPGPTKCASRR